MRRHAIYWCLGLLALTACSHTADVDSLQPGAAVTLTRQDGQAVKGKVVKVTPDDVVLQVTPDERQQVPRQAVKKVDVADEAPEARDSATPSEPAFQDITIPAGTELSVALETPVGSATSDAGDPVRASLVEALVIDGVPAIPANATVTGEVITARSSGKVKGRAAVVLRFNEVMVGDRQYAIDATPVDREAASTKKKDALSIGIPAAAGSIIGAIAGGKKGAVVGGAVGGGAGTAYVLSTPGREIVLRAGTHVQARLTKPLTVRVPRP
jgi:hypothetical protein